MIDHFLLLNVVIYIPFAIVMLGMWIERKHAELFPPLIYLIVIYSTLALVFTFPSIYGTFFHSLAPMIPFLYAWALSGIDTILTYLSKQLGKRHKHAKKTTDIFLALRAKGLARFSRIAIPKHDAGSPQVSSKSLLKDGGVICLAIAMVIAIISVGKTALTTSATSSDYILYQQVGKIVASDYRENGMLHNSVQPIVMVADSADYYYATGQHAVLLPAQPLPTVLDAAQSYSVSYILFTPNQGKEEQQIWKRTLTGSRLKLLWSSPSGKLYRFHDPSNVTAG